jgi:trypsin
VAGSCEHGIEPIGSIKARYALTERLFLSRRSLLLEVICSKYLYLKSETAPPILRYLLQVSVPFEYSDSVQPIPMSSLTPPAGTPVVVTGWGRLRTGGTSPTQLQQVQVNVMDYEECDSAYWEYGGITARMLCAGVPAGGKDACQGDSGGPLVTAGRLSGIVSWGDDCGREGFPGVYTNVAVLKSWVTSVTGVE